MKLKNNKEESVLDMIKANKHPEIVQLISQKYNESVRQELDSLPLPTVLLDIIAKYAL